MHFWYLIFKVCISDKILRSRIPILYITLQFNPIYIFKYIDLLLLVKSPPPAKKTKQFTTNQNKNHKTVCTFQKRIFFLSMQHFVYAFRNIYTLYWYITFYNPKFWLRLRLDSCMSNCFLRLKSVFNKKDKKQLLTSVKKNILQLLPISNKRSHSTFSR